LVGPFIKKKKYELAVFLHKLSRILYLEKLQYRTFQTGVGGQSILPVPTNAYAVSLATILALLVVGF
jgi:hypothetical protein